MTLGVRQSLSGGEAIAGIYFRRRLNRPNIKPVYVSGGDAEVLHRIFRRYKRKFTRDVVSVNPLQNAADIDELLTDAFSNDPSRRPVAESMDQIERRVYDSDQESKYLAAYWQPREGGAERLGVLSFKVGDPVELSVVAVRRDWHGNGIGRHLIEEMERRVGGQTIALDTPKQNEPFLSAAGYQIETTTARGFRMKKELRGA